MRRLMLDVAVIVHTPHTVLASRRALCWCVAVVDGCAFGMG